jgi:hypothetical protein
MTETDRVFLLLLHILVYIQEPLRGAATRQASIAIMAGNHTFSFQALHLQVKVMWLGHHQQLAETHEDIGQDTVGFV